VSATVAATRERQFTRRRIPEYLPSLVGVLIVVALTSNANVQFLGGGGWRLVLVYAAPVILLAMAQAPAVISGNGGIDLSGGPTMGLISVVVVGVLVPQGVTSPAAVLTLALAMGMLVGVINGAMIAYVRIPPIIATLATYLIFSGLSVEVLGAPTGVVPSWFSSLVDVTLGLPNVGYVILLVCALWGVLMRSAFGRNLRAVGSNDRAAYTAGVPVARVRLAAYVISGLISGIAALVLIAVLGGADATVGPTYTLKAIAAVALGGLSLSGGRGGMASAVCGATLLFLIQNYLTFIDVSPFVLQMIYGAILVFAVAASGTWTQLRERSR
jgi:ribose transport system permease protein